MVLDAFALKNPLVVMELEQHVYVLDGLIHPHFVDAPKLHTTYRRTVPGPSSLQIR